MLGQSQESQKEKTTYCFYYVYCQYGYFYVGCSKKRNIYYRLEEELHDRGMYRQAAWLRDKTPLDAQVFLEIPNIDYKKACYIEKRAVEHLSKVFGKDKVSDGRDIRQSSPDEF